MDYLGGPKPSSESRGDFGFSFVGYSIGESIPCGNGGVPATCSNSSDGGVVTVSTFLGGLPGLSSEKPEVGPSTEGLGGGFFSLGS